MIKYIKNLFRPAPPAPQNGHEKYMTWLRQYAPPFTSKRIELRQRYIDASQTSWYDFANPLSMSEERANALDDAVQRVRFSMTNTEAQKRLSAIRAKAEAVAAHDDVTKMKKYAEAIAADVADMEYRVSKLPRMELLIEVAIILFCMEGENPYQYNVLTQAEKRKAVADDDNLRAFFLRTAYSELREATQPDVPAFLRSLGAGSAKALRISLQGTTSVHTKTHKPPVHKST